MAITTEIAKPNVPIWHTAQVPKETLQQIQYGLEEEGVPCVLQEMSGDAVSIGYQAAKSARFEVAIGADASRIVIHNAKFSHDKPLISIPTKATVDMLRAIGADAARIVKRLPLKMADRR